MDTNAEPVQADDESIQKTDDDRSKEVKIDMPEFGVEIPRVHASSFKNRPWKKRSKKSMSLQETRKDFYKNVAGLDPVLEEKGKTGKKIKCSSLYKKADPKDESPFGKQKYWVYFFKEMQGNVPPTGGPLEYDPDSRQGFVRFVFLLVFIMLVCTSGFVALVFNVEDLYDIFSDRSLFWFLIIPPILILYIMGYVFSCSDCSRRAPFSYICLFIVCTAQSVIVAVICCRYDMKQIIIAVVVTALIAAFCLCLAMTSFDFTKYYLYFVVIAFGVSMLGMGIFIAMKVFGWKMKGLVIVILFAYVIISSISILMELQMILGGKTIEMGEEDYSLAAYMLYSSMIQLFLQLLQLIGLLEN